MSDTLAPDKTAQSEKILQKARDERMKSQTRWRKFLQHPEFGALAGVILVFIFFGITAGDSGMFAADGVLNWTTVSAQLILIACAAALLMIGGGIRSLGRLHDRLRRHDDRDPDGLFRLVGPGQHGFRLRGRARGRFPERLDRGAHAPAVLHRDPGLALYSARPHHRALHRFLQPDHRLRCERGGGRQHHPGAVLRCCLSPLFVWFSDIGFVDKLADGTPAVQGIPAVILWAIGLAFIAHVILTRTPGSATGSSPPGGDANAARNVGVPVSRVKIALFMFTAFCATVYAANQIFEFGSAASDRGLLKEFEAIIAAVIGGCLLTGGYGSIVGACFGALIFGVVQMGILFTGVPNDWFRSSSEPCC